MTEVHQGALLYSGKAKSLYQTDREGVLLCEFRDDTTAFDGEKKAKLQNKGSINQQISTHIFQVLAKSGVATHWLDTISPTHILVRHLKMIPLESVVRNRAAGSLCRRLGVEPGKILPSPLYELFLKDDALHDPMVNEAHALCFGWATREQLVQMQSLTGRINDVLSELFADAGMILVDAKFEFGVDASGNVYLGDEISPDSCRIWDAKTLRPLDKDRFRQDLGDVMSSYQLIADRLLG